MNRIETKEIFSSQMEQYKTLLAIGLQREEESLIMTPEDHSNALFPTKDRNDSFTLGAYVENVLAGVVSFTRDGEDREKLRHKGTLFTMYVLKEFRGQGIAGELIEELIKRVKALTDIEQINLIVISNNSGAKRLYEKFGFKIYGTEQHSIKWKNKYFTEDQMVLRLVNDKI
jgi:ribosomal protein S18 acetylase RimI-like enzyme